MLTNEISTLFNETDLGSQLNQIFTNILSISAVCAAAAAAAGGISSINKGFRCCIRKGGGKGGRCWGKTLLNPQEKLEKSGQ